MGVIHFDVPAFDERDFIEPDGCCSFCLRYDGHTHDCITQPLDPHDDHREHGGEAG